MAGDTILNVERPGNLSLCWGPFSTELHEVRKWVKWTPREEQCRHRKHSAPEARTHTARVRRSEEVRVTGAQESKRRVVRDEFTEEAPY